MKYEEIRERIYKLFEKNDYPDDTEIGVMIWKHAQEELINKILNNLEDGEFHCLQDTIYYLKQLKEKQNDQ